MATATPGSPDLATESPSAESVRLELDCILACKSFAGSKRLSAFLRFIVERTLSGDVNGIKEYAIGAQVYERGLDFEPRVANSVRVEGNRLGANLRDSYARQGGHDSVRIEIPKGSYTPVFQMAAP